VSAIAPSQRERKRRRPRIPQDHNTHVFSRFQKVDSSNTKAKGGMVLGHVVAKLIVEMHLGRIDNATA
jgi:signal transduction histidine kinase